MERGEARDHLDVVSQVCGTWQGAPRSVEELQGCSGTFERSWGSGEVPSEERHPCLEEDGGSCGLVGCVLLGSGRRQCSQRWR